MPASIRLKVKIADVRIVVVFVKTDIDLQVGAVSVKGWDLYLSGSIIKRLLLQ